MFPEIFHSYRKVVIIFGRGYAPENQNQELLKCYRTFVIKGRIKLK